MSDYSFTDIEDIKAEEKRLYESYKEQLAELRKIKKENEAVGQVFTKGLLPIYTLYILAQGPTNGNDIATKIGNRTNGLWIPSTGGIYPLLKKFEKQGLIVGHWNDPNKKNQKIYSLTPEGISEFEKRKCLLQDKIKGALLVFEMIYKDIYD